MRGARSGHEPLTPRLPRTGNDAPAPAPAPALMPGTDARRICGV
ncbi:hypothetical protein [Arthrobacter sp. G119Y2]